MGTISKGILGGFSGTVGTVIGGSWKGIDYMRSQPSKRSGNFSQAQLEQQAFILQWERTITTRISNSILITKVLSNEFDCSGFSFFFSSVSLQFEKKVC